MYLKVKSKKIPIKDYKSIKEKFKSFKFYLKPIDFGIRTKGKIATTYFFCQKVDICLTDKDNNILALYENIKSEKRKINLKTYYIYYLPLDTCKCLTLGTRLILKDKDKK